MSNLASGVDVPIPTCSPLSMVIANASALSSIPVDLKEVNVPVLVIFG